MDITGLIIGVVALVIGVAVGYLVKNIQETRRNQQLNIEADQIIKDANSSAKNIEIQAKDQALEIRQKAERETERKRQELNREEDRLQEQHLSTRSIHYLPKKNDYRAVGVLQMSPEFGAFDKSLLQKAESPPYGQPVFRSFSHGRVSRPKSEG